MLSGLRCLQQSLGVLWAQSGGYACWAGQVGVLSGGLLCCCQPPPLWRWPRQWWPLRKGPGRSSLPGLKALEGELLLVLERSGHTEFSRQSPEHRRAHAPTVIPRPLPSCSVLWRPSGSPSHGVVGTRGSQGPVDGGVRNGNWYFGGEDWLGLSFRYFCSPRSPGHCGVSSPHPRSGGQLGPGGEAGLWRVGVSAFAETGPCHPVASMTT